MATITVADLETQIAELTKRLAELELRTATAAAAPAPPAAAAPAPAPETITERGVARHLSRRRAHIWECALTSGRFDCSAPMHGHNRGACRSRRRTDYSCQMSAISTPDTRAALTMEPLTGQAKACDRCRVCFSLPRRHAEHAVSGEPSASARKSRGCKPHLRVER